MQILGIMGQNGHALPNVTITMFTSAEDMVMIDHVVNQKEEANAKRPEFRHFNRTRAHWDAEFECHKTRLREQVIDSVIEKAKMAGNKQVSRHNVSPEIHVFPLEVREYANNRTVHQRLVEHGIGI